MEPADNHQARSEICPSGRSESLAAVADAAVFLPGEVCLLLRDFEEMVLTYSSDFGKLFEKNVVHRHH